MTINFVLVVFGEKSPYPAVDIVVIEKYSGSMGSLNPNSCGGNREYKKAYMTAMTMAERYSIPGGTSIFLI